MLKSVRLSSVCHPALSLQLKGTPSSPRQLDDTSATLTQARGSAVQLPLSRDPGHAGLGSRYRVNPLVPTMSDDCPPTSSHIRDAKKQHKHGHGSKARTPSEQSH